MGQTKDINLLDLSNEEYRDVSMLCNAFDVVSSAYPTLIFDWTQPCTCTPLGIEKETCPKHSQVIYSIVELFDGRKEQLLSFVNHGNHDEKIKQEDEKLEEKHVTATAELSSLNINWENMDNFEVDPSPQTI